MNIRVTNLGKFQVVRADGDLSQSPCFQTRGEAEDYANRPTPRWQLDEQARATERQPYLDAYAAVLASPTLREMRQDIQEAYGEAAGASKRANAAQRAAIRGMGQISCMGRDIGSVRQGEADYQGREADSEWQRWRFLAETYERAVQADMIKAGIPVALFRQEARDR